MKCSLLLCVGFFLISCNFLMNLLMMDVEYPLYQYESFIRIYLPILFQSASCKFFQETLKDKLGDGRCGKDTYDNEYDIMEPY
jgi:hypothetical protein